MTKTKSQRKRAKNAKSSRPAQTRRNPAKKHPAGTVQGKKSARRRARGKKQGKPSIGKSVSMVSDGVNVGSVWKNTTSERVTFPVAREKIADLTSTGTTFQTLLQLYCNPGNSILHPIFSNIARNYEEYVPNTFKIYFRTEEYMASGNNVAAGLVAMGVNFDPDAANFVTITELENYEHSISGAPFTGIMCLDVMEHHRKKFKGKSRDLSLNNYFVNYAPNQLAPSNTPAKFYDFGNLQIDCFNTQAAIIGEVWVEYSYTLIRRLQNPGSPFGGAIHFSGTTPTTANNFATALVQSGATLAGITLGVNTIVFPAGIPGNYFIYLAVGGTTATTLNASGGTALNLFTQGGVRDENYIQISSTAATPGNSVLAYSITVAPSGTTVTITPSTIVGGAVMDLFIFSLPSTLITFETKKSDEMSELITELQAMKLAISFMQRNSTRYGSPYISVEEEKELLECAATHSSSSSSSSSSVIKCPALRKGLDAVGETEINSGVSAVKQVCWSLSN